MKTPPHITLDGDGNAIYRTRLLEQAKAERFARCLSSNIRFLLARPIQSERATGRASWFVEYIPASEERQASIHKALQDRRAARAEEEGHGYTYFADSALRGGAVWCVSVSGCVYCVGRNQCDCSDYTCRCRKANLLCKHILAYRAAGPDAVIQQDGERAVAA